MKGRTAFFLFALLCAVYALSYGGAFTVDDEHLFASGALSLAERGRFEVPQVYGNTRIQGEYRDVEPGQVVLGSLLVRWADFIHLGRVQSMFLLNIGITALTAIVVYATLLVLNYSLSVAVVGALLYGLTTLAWVYATTYYRDPLAALALAVAYLGFEVAFTPNRSKAGRWWGAALCVVGLIGGLLAKSTVMVALVIFPLVALIRLPREQLTWAKLKWPLVAAAIVTLALIGLSLTISSTGPFNRFSWSYLTSLLGYFIQAPHPAFIEAFLGPLVSPGKSLFLYSPILCLALPSLYLARNNHRGQPLLPWFTLFALIILQALFYDAGWFGDTNYGLRFLLPALPLMIVACAPVLERAVAEGRGAWRWALATLGLAGIFVQVAGVLINARTYYATLFQIDSVHVPYLAAWNPATSAILGHWQLILAGTAWNLALTRDGSLAPLGVSVAIIGWLIVLGLSAWMLWRPSLNRSWQVGATIGATSLLLLLPVVMLNAYRNDPLYSSSEASFTQATDYLANHSKRGDVVFVEHYGAPLWHYFMNTARLPVIWYSLPLEVATPNAPPSDLALETLLNRLKPATCRIWLVNDLTEFPGEAEQAHTWLLVHWPLTTETTFTNSARTLKLSLFTLNPACL